MSFGSFTIVLLCDSYLFFLRSLISLPVYYSLVTMPFKLQSDYEPKGDQPQAIDALVRGLEDGAKDQVLLGITGSGKTFTIASVIQKTQRPTLVMAHNKTLAAQLYQEFKTLFPENAVEYFVSYYDYYQPEAYMPSADLYIEKEAIVNDDIDRLRMSATRALFERRDVIVVASVSCIYGLGDPDAYYGMLLFLEPGDHQKRVNVTGLPANVAFEVKPAEVTLKTKKRSVLSRREVAGRPPAARGLRRGARRQSCRARPTAPSRRRQ